MLYLSRAALQRARGKVPPIECLHTVMRSLLFDSKVRQRNNIMSILKNVIAPTIRTRALAVPAVKEVVASSAVWGSANATIVPMPVGAAGSSGGASSSTSSTSAAAASGSAGAPRGGSGVHIPTATPVSSNRKAAQAVEAEIKSAPISEIFLDADWMLDEVIEDNMEAAIASLMDTRSKAMLARLDKLPGKLGFSSA